MRWHNLFGDCAAATVASGMLRAIAAILLAGTFALQPATDTHVLRTQPSSAEDLELGGELKGVPAGNSRYLCYEDLLQLPQETYTVSDDSNFPKGAKIQGVSLDTLAKLFGEAPDDALIVAISYD